MHDQISILVVEDDLSLREILTEVFKYEGYRFEFSTGIDDITSLVADFKPDVVLLDYLLPKINGGELCCQLKSHMEFSHIPVIIYSAFSKVFLSLGDYGCDFFIEKPFDLDYLLKKINQISRIYQHKHI